ncbi:hypothetical protein ISN44_As02g006070 [Arabidopsis suecica]|uniref:Uncharacterized protein n=1 Tax=Arabidopsis suecica TaxID=45249 RepID=A0A8T2G1R6_ARASU|nr:hypothetical protein ISN44_As02g006070 [Arabidopsis suecica]
MTGNAMLRKELLSTSFAVSDRVYHREICVTSMVLILISLEFPCLDSLRMLRLSGAGLVMEFLIPRTQFTQRFVTRFLRYLVRLIRSTLLCKMKPGKMRLSVLLLLYHAVHDFFPDSFGVEEVVRDVNFGVLFAHHLVSLKTKPFTRKRKKSKRVGSLLTPIFEHFRIIFEGEERQTRHHMIQLPCPTLTEITGEHEEIGFHYDPSRLHSAPCSRRQRGSASGSAPTQTEDEFIDPVGGPRVGSSSLALPYELPSPTPIPIEPYVFQEYIVDSFKSVWNAIATLSRCGCVASTRRRHRSPSPTSGSEHED